LYEKSTEKAKLSKKFDFQEAAQNVLADCYLDSGANFEAMAIRKQNIVFLNKHKTKNYLLLAKDKVSMSSLVKSNYVLLKKKNILNFEINQLL